MEKKFLKVYEAPAVEVVEVEMAGAMLAGSGGGTNSEDTGFGGSGGGEEI